MGYETPTFERVTASSKAQCFQLRCPIELVHLSPAALKSILMDFLEMSNTQQKARFFMNGLLNVQQDLGTVTQAFVYKFQQILQRFHLELSDLQQVLMY